MPLEVRYLHCFDRQFKAVLKHFPQAEKDVREAINGLAEKPMAGDAFPGFGNSVNVRKMRIALKAYNLSESKGLRVIFMVVQKKSLIVPLHLYKKGKAGGEQDVINQTRKQLNAVLKEL